MWKPIDTAPDDGKTEFLAYDPVAKKFDVCFREYRPSYVYPPSGKTYPEYWTLYSTQSGDFYDEPDFCTTRATHWMPLPDAPS